MYEVIKVLNNNTLLTSKDNQNVIFLGKGIGFKRKAGELFEPDDQCQQYALVGKDKGKRNNGKDIVSINPIYIEIASKIINLAKEKFEHVDEKILLPLVDHIEFAITRLNNNMQISNPFTKDIELLFPEEYKIALKGREIIKQYTEYDIPNDEVGYITLHVHSAISTSGTTDSIQVMEIIRENIDQLRKDLKITIDENSIAYTRLMNHLKYLLLRLNTEEKLQMDISDFTKTKFPFAYEQATKMCHQLSKVLEQEIPETEIGYLALHLERILSLEIK